MVLNLLRLVAKGKVFISKAQEIAERDGFFLQLITQLTRSTRKNNRAETLAAFGKDGLDAFVVGGYWGTISGVSLHPTSNANIQVYGEVDESAIRSGENLVQNSRYIS